MSGQALSVEQATEGLYTFLAEQTGWKLLKSRRCLKKTIGDLTFELLFFSSKWNVSYERVEVECEFRFYSKQLGKTGDVSGLAGFCKIGPPGHWWNISQKEMLEQSRQAILAEVRTTAVALAERFEQDDAEAVRYLLTDDAAEKYHLRLEFAALRLGKEAVRQKAQALYNGLNDEMRQQAEAYRQGARNKMWMVNPSNLRYILDEGLV